MDCWAKEPDQGHSPNCKKRRLYAGHSHRRTSGGKAEATLKNQFRAKRERWIIAETATGFLFGDLQLILLLFGHGIGKVRHDEPLAVLLFPNAVVVATLDILCRRILARYPVSSIGIAKVTRT